MAQATVTEWVWRVQATSAPPLTFTVEFHYDPQDKGYLAKCPELDAVAWGETWEEAKQELLDAVTDIAEVLVEMHDRNPKLCDPSLPHARYIVSLGDEEKVRELFGL